jgi:hypothetical protein
METFKNQLLSINRGESGCVYFIKHIGLTPIKIGMTTENNPDNRLLALSTSSPFGMELIGYINTDSPKTLELYFHKKYKNERMNGEWFNVSVDRIKKEIEKYNNGIIIEDKIKTHNECISYLQKNKVSPNEYLEILQLCASELEIDTISEMARKENKSPQGINISNKYFKVFIGKQKFAVKGLSDKGLPF